MINIAFFSKGDRLTGYHITGHSDYSEAGSDIVCAAVSSAAYMTANTVTEILHLTPEITVNDGEMKLRLNAMTDADRAADLLNGFRLHMMELQEQYPDFIHIT